jgi:hypothetical protein
MGDQDIAPLSFRSGSPGPLDGLFKRLSTWFKVLLPE